MKAFHDDPQFKAQLVEAAIAHREADDYISGTYVEKNGRFRGCSVGCSLYDVQKIRGTPVISYGNHERLAKTLGVPEWLCHLQDSIFEGLPADQRSRWTERLYAAIPVGADLEPVRHRLAIRRLTRLADTQKKALGSSTDDAVLAQTIREALASLAQVIECHRAELGEIDCAPDWSAAQSAARRETRSTRYSAAPWVAAYSAVESAVESAAELAESVAESARSAAESARSTRYSAARSAAYSAAQSAAWLQEADNLIELLAGEQS